MSLRTIDHADLISGGLQLFAHCRITNLTAKWAVDFRFFCRLGNSMESCAERVHIKWARKLLIPPESWIGNRSVISVSTVPRATPWSSCIRKTAHRLKAGSHAAQLFPVSFSFSDLNSFYFLQSPDWKDTNLRSSTSAYIICQQRPCQFWPSGA